jgi:hypothetical protein
MRARHLTVGRARASVAASPGVQRDCIQPAGVDSTPVDAGVPTTTIGSGRAGAARAPRVVARQALRARERAEGRPARCARVSIIRFDALARLAAALVDGVATRAAVAADERGAGVEAGARAVSEGEQPVTPRQAHEHGEARQHWRELRRARGTPLGARGRRSAFGHAARCAGERGAESARGPSPGRRRHLTGTR